MIKKKILITGGAGFIGSALIRHIIDSSNHIVYNVDKLTYASNLNSLRKIRFSKRYFFKKLDINNTNGVKKIFNKFKPNLIIHLAAETHVDRSINGPSEFIKTNIYGTYSLLETSLNYWINLKEKNKKSFRFHHVSTDEVFGDLAKKKGLFKESSPYAPSSPYSASKASSDHLVRAWHRTFKFPILITNCSNNYGPYQNPEKLIPLVISNALENKEIPVYGNGKQIRDWLHVDDHSRALLKVALKGKVGETYNIGGNNELKNIDVVNTICSILDDLYPLKNKKIKKYRELIKYVNDRPGHDQRYAIDTTKIKKELNWRPKESFKTGIKKTIKWYIKNKHFYETLKKEI